MKNVGIIVERRKGADKRYGKSFEDEKPAQMGCCSIISTMDDEVVAYIKKSWMDKLGRDVKWIKRWETMCRRAGLPWKYIGETPDYYLTRIYNDETIKGKHRLAVFTTIRYMYSPYYNDIPQHAMNIYKGYKVTNLMAILIAHSATKKMYEQYYGLRRNNLSMTQKRITASFIRERWTFDRTNNINNMFGRGRVRSVNLTVKTRSEAKKGNYEKLMEAHKYATRK